MGSLCSEHSQCSSRNQVWSNMILYKISLDRYVKWHLVSKTVSKIIDSQINLDKRCLVLSVSNASTYCMEIIGVSVSTGTVMTTWTFNMQDWHVNGLYHIAKVRCNSHIHYFIYISKPLFQFLSVSSVTSGLHQSDNTNVHEPYSNHCQNFPDSGPSK